MKPTFYPRLAWMGIKKNARLYVPYLLSCAFMTAMLYVIAYLAVTPALYTVNGKVNGSGTSAVAMTMSLGSFVVSVFIALFLFYTNSFLLRRRKKEFGLYSVLGMDRGALSAILFWETLLAAAFTLIAGLGLGLLLSALGFPLFTAHIHFIVVQRHGVVLPILNDALLYCISSDKTRGYSPK